MSGFVVDSRTLVAVRDTLGRLQDQLVGMHTVIWHQWGTLGGHALESELEHFCGTWHYGVSELGGQLQDLNRRLGEAASAYDRIEQRIIHASGGSATGTGGAPVTGTGSSSGSGHSTKPAHHPAKHSGSAHHTPEHSAAHYHSNPTGGGGTHYSGGAGLAPAPTGSGNSGHSGDKHSGGEKHAGVGSGTTMIGGGADHGSGSDHYGGAQHNGNSGSGTGTTVIPPGGGGSHEPAKHHPSSVVSP